MKHLTQVITLLSFVALAGCASNSDLEAIQAQVRQANETADMALKTANAAKAEATNATEIAEAARASADATENKVEYLLKKQKPVRK